MSNNLATSSVNPRVESTNTDSSDESENEEQQANDIKENDVSKYLVKCELSLNKLILRIILRKSRLNSTPNQTTTTKLNTKIPLRDNKFR